MADVTAEKDRSSDKSRMSDGTKASGRAWDELWDKSTATRKPTNKLDQALQEKELEFSNPYPQELSKQKTHEWTVAIQLSSAQFETPERTPKLDKLKELAKYTENKPLTFVVQKVLSHDDGSAPTIENYKIAGGNVLRQTDTESKGFAGDVQELLTKANQENPAHKLALVIQSHGTAGSGMHGENGKTSVDELAKAIKSGLNGSGHDKLDLLDFDACLMSETTVIDKMKDLTKNVVASEEMETAIGKDDGQNLFESLKSLTENPSMSGNELAESMVSSAKAGKDGEGTHSLSHINTEQYDAFRKQLDVFGEQLRNSAANEENQKVIQQLIASTHKLGQGITDMEIRDLKGFTESVQDAIKSGQLKDPDGKLLDASVALLKEEKKTVESTYGLDRGLFQNMNDLGGLSVFLPQLNFLVDQKEQLIPLTPLGMIEVLGRMIKVENRERYENRLTEFVHELKNDAANSPEEYKKLESAVTALKSAPDESQFQQRKKELEELCRQLAKGNLNDPSIESVKEQRKMMRKDILQDEVQAVDDGGWKHFLEYVTKVA